MVDLRIIIINFTFISKINSVIRMSIDFIIIIITITIIIIKLDSIGTFTFNKVIKDFKIIKMFRFHQNYYVLLPKILSFIKYITFVFSNILIHQKNQLASLCYYKFK
jgi:hypothetical protein